MGKIIWVVILIVVVALLWFLFRGESAEAPVDSETENTEQSANASATTKENSSADVSNETGAEVNISVDAGTTTSETN